MSQLLALEWNGSEARLVAASSRGGRVVIEQAFSVDLRPQQPDTPPDEVDVGKRIGAAMAAHGVGRGDTLVAIGRSNIELRQLTLPPAPEDELPEMVRFQALREFAQMSEDSLLDFVPIDLSTDEPQSVLAAAIDPELVGQIRQTCQTAGVKPRCLILRPCAAASLIERHPVAEPGELCLLVDLLTDEADLTVLRDGKVVFLRTARMVNDPLEGAGGEQALLGELRRTLAAAQNQLGGERVASIALCGSGPKHEALAAAIGKALSVPCELFDPFADVRLGRELRDSLPDHPGRFAPLVGMALAELENKGHSIDFLHPRQPAKVKSRYQTPAIIALVAALVVAAVGVFGYYTYRSSLQDRITALRQQKKDIEGQIQIGNEALKAMKDIDKWLETDVVWLDEMRILSDRFPMADRAMLSNLTIDQAPGLGGKMTLKGLARDSDTIAEMTNGLDDGSRRVEGDNNEPDSSISPYSRAFTLSLRIAREEE